LLSWYIFLLLFKDKEKIQDARWLNSLGRYDFVSQRPVSTPFDYQIGGIAELCHYIQLDVYFSDNEIEWLIF